MGYKKKICILAAMTEPKDDDENHPLRAIKKFGILPWILTALLIASTGLNLWQKHQITLFQPQAVKQLCANRYDTIDSSSNNNNINNNFEQSNDVIIIPATSTSQIAAVGQEQKNGGSKNLNKNRTKWKAGLSKNGKRKSYYKVQKPVKTCPLISSIHSKKDYGARMYEIGSAIRSDDLWYITEYAMGYMLFEYNSTTSADNNNNSNENLLKIPTNIYTLPMPFSGTDHTVAKHASDGSRIFYYQISSTNSILGYNVKDDKSVQKEIAFDRKPLYKHSASEIDLEFDEEFLYAIFRERNNTVLTILKLHPWSLKQLEKHQIIIHFADHVINSFISCHTFYIVKQEDTVENIQIEPIYDLLKKEYIKIGPKNESYPKWKSSGIPTNVQFDSISQSLNVFDKGNIYSLLISR
uniref:Olfactomedin-like domain-containing protein n=1 Tax=Panagrolaimus sp. ES5 TaxID=591445 RepID=A0AC34F646_9BILA